MSLIDVPREQSFHFCPHLLNRDLECPHSLRRTSGKFGDLFKGVPGLERGGDDGLKTVDKFLCRRRCFKPELLEALHQLFGDLL